MENEFSRTEIWLLDLVCRLKYPLDVLVAENIEVICNRDGHGLSENDLTRVLYNLLNAGLIFFELPIEDNTPEGIVVTPSLPQLKAGFLAEPEMYFGLTSEGGRVWEQLSHPNWDRFVDESYDIKKGHIISANPEWVQRALNATKSWARNSCSIENESWSVISPWKATYWKTLPLGHRVDFTTVHFSDEEAIIREEQETSAERQQRNGEWREWINEGGRAW